MKRSDSKSMRDGIVVCVALFIISLLLSVHFYLSIEFNSVPRIPEVRSQNGVLEKDPVVVGRQLFFFLNTGASYDALPFGAANEESPREWIGELKKGDEINFDLLKFRDSYFIVNVRSGTSIYLPAEELIATLESQRKGSKISFVISIISMIAWASVILKIANYKFKLKKAGIP